jgi:hypothetical protein
MDIDAFDFLDFDIFGSGEGLEESRVDVIEDKPEADPAGYLARSHNYWQQIPLPSEFSLSGTNILAAMTDEVLLGMSSSLIAHVQRTEASNGLQVISPRAVTLGGIAARTGHSKRTTDMFLVGSSASRNLDWPTVKGRIDDHLFWAEPIDAYPSEPASRPKTVTTGLLPSTRLISDPITRAFLTGRALVDLQRRPDVAGSAEALSAVLATCWGVDPDAYEDLAEASLAPSGPLLRYAIRTDGVYPTINAPIQARKCITVGANTAGRHLYGEHSAVDWRRLRVLAEAVFYQSSRLENYTLAQMSLDIPPGNPRAPPNRSGILQLRPLPGSVWSFDSSTFRLEVDTDISAIVGVVVPERVRLAVEHYHDSARPVAHAEAGRMNVSYSTSLEHSITTETREGVVAGYKAVLTANATVSARGRTSAAAVRGFVYDCLAESTSLSAIRTLWLARYMHETTEALNLTHLLDVTTTRHIAARMSDVTTDMRMKLGVEAGRRGSDLGSWWESMTAQLPGEIRAMSEGSASWSLALSHLVLHPATPKWAGLVRAMAHASHATMARGHLKDVRLPAKLGSAERSFAAGTAVARQLGTSYGAFYLAMYDVSSVLAARLRRAGNRAGAEKIHLAGLMWDIRAKLAATVSLHAVDGTSEEAGAFNSRHGRYHLTTAPYPAYQRWHRELNASKVVPRSAKVRFPHHTPPKVSLALAGITEPLFSIPVGSTSRLYRYAACPDKLAKDIERTLDLITTDVSLVMSYYDHEEEEVRQAPDPRPGRSEPVAALALDLARFVPRVDSYWDVIAKMEPLDAQDMVDSMAKMDDALSSEIEAESYESIEALKRAVWGSVEAAGSARAATRDAVN